MRIGFSGNQNNYPFMLARAIRWLGHDVRFFVDSTEPLHRPEFRYDDIRHPYPDWIVDLAPFSLPNYVIPTRKHRRLIAELRQCDAVVLNQFSPSLFREIGRPAIILLTGTDLAYFANLASLNRPFSIVGKRPALFWNTVIPFALKILNRRIIPAQREAISNAVAVSFFWKGVNPPGDALLEELGVGADRRIFFLMADLEQIEPEPPPRNDRIRTFCATRLVWKKPFPAGFTALDDKRSDVMIEGIARFWRDTGIRLDIRLVRKGLHVRETVELAERSGIADQITWLEEMTQTAVREEFRRADIIFETFGPSIVAMAGLDAMATARPVIGDAHPEILEPILGAASPICQATTPDQVAAEIKRLLDPGLRQEIGKASRRYVEQFFSPEQSARVCVERLEQALGERAEPAA